MSSMISGLCGEKADTPMSPARMLANSCGSAGSEMSNWWMWVASVVVSFRSGHQRHGEVATYSDSLEA